MSAVEHMEQIRSWIVGIRAFIPHEKKKFFFDSCIKKCPFLKFCRLRPMIFFWSDNCSKSNQNIKKDSLISISTYLVFWRSLHDQQSILAFLYSVLWPRWGLATWVITFWREKLWKMDENFIFTFLVKIAFANNSGKFLLFHIRIFFIYA